VFLITTVDASAMLVGSLVIDWDMMVVMVMVMGMMERMDGEGFKWVVDVVVVWSEIFGFGLFVFVGPP